MNNEEGKLSKLRKAKGYNQRKFAELIGISQPLLIKIEKGDLDRASMRVAKEMAKLLEISIGELFGLENFSSEKEKELKDFFLENTLKLEKALNDKDKYIALLENSVKKKSDDIFSSAIAVSEMMNVYLEEKKSELGIDDKTKEEIFEMIQACHYVAMDEIFLKYLGTPEDNFRKENPNVEYPGEGERVEYFRTVFKNIRRFPF